MSKIIGYIVCEIGGAPMKLCCESDEIWKNIPPEGILLFSSYSGRDITVFDHLVWAQRAIQRTKAYHDNYPADKPPFKRLAAVAPMISQPRSRHIIQYEVRECYAPDSIQAKHSPPNPTEGSKDA